MSARRERPRYVPLSPLAHSAKRRDADSRGAAAAYLVAVAMAQGSDDALLDFLRKRDLVPASTTIMDPAFRRYADAVDLMLDVLRMYYQEEPVSKHAMTADVTSPGRGVGFSDEADIDFLITREGGQWLVYESVTGSPEARGRTLAEALRKFARLLDLTGTIELCWETRGDTKEVITI